MLFAAQYTQFDAQGNESVYWNMMPQYFCPVFTILQFIFYVG